MRKLNRLRAIVIATAASCAVASAEPTPSQDEVSARHEVVAAFARWLDATNAGDLEAQREFYPAKMDAFYLWRAVPQADVLAEKRRVFASANVIHIKTEAPQIVVDPGARTARMYFRKVYTIRGPRVDREGEVLQELLWRKEPTGWKITSERDLLVLD